MIPTPQTQNLRRAIFLDRDGTLNEEVGYVRNLDEFRLFDFAGEAVRLVNEAGWLVIVVTNQSGVARGKFSEEFLNQVHAQMLAKLENNGAQVDGIYFCPHHPEIGETPYRQVCDCRKPQPGLLLRAAKDFDLDLSLCAVIGDRLRDVGMAKPVGSRSVLVLTGYGQEELYEANSPEAPDHVATNLLEAVRWVINEFKPKS
ncbi:MAG: D-glycero-beta-D-manno-heptose 1,7-bisphosphate 7-phosphatase [Blastocatellia bacterium]